MTKKGNATMEDRLISDEIRRRGKERVQLDFSQEALERLDLLRTKIGASTRAETIRQALRLYDWFVTETRPDSTIEVIDSNGETMSKFKASLLHNNI